MAKRLKKPTQQLFPSNIEKEYRKRLLDFVNFMTEQTKTRVTPKLPELYESLARSRNYQIKTDNYSDDLDRLLSELFLIFSSRLSRNQIQALAEDVAVSTSQFNKAQIIRQFDRVLGINPLIFGESWLTEEVALFVKNNVTLVQSLQDDYRKKLEISINNAVQKGLTNRSLASEIQSNFTAELSKVTDNTRARAELIARDQLSKFNGQLTELRQQDAGIDEYEWQTAGDERVRESHRILNGKIFKWNNPPSVGHPGQDYNCRCIAVPIFKGSTQEEALDNLLNRRE